MNRDNRIFVFGSNLAGRHGKGAALHAVKHFGAEYGNPSGRQGNAFAIPTKTYDLKPLPLLFIFGYVYGFKAYARAHPELRFQVTAIGCGLAGYKPEQIAFMFSNAPDNCELPPEFLAILGRAK